MKKMFALLLILVVVPGLMWLGCDTGPSQVSGPDDESEEGIGKAALPSIAMQKISEIQDKHTPELLGKPGVVGTGIGLGPDGNPAIVVLTARPGVAGIPMSLEDVAVVVQVIGEIKAFPKPTLPPGLTKIDPTARFNRPVPIGVSTGHPDITAGTIGCRVKDVDGNVYALSNNHVYADENLASIGDAVLQPGPYDGGGDPADAIGSLYDYEPINFGGSNTIDAAIALSDISRLDNTTPSNGYGIPSSTPAPATIGLSVKKYGRTTGLTTGEVALVNVSANVTYSTGTALFTDQIMITPGTFSSGGDSGSLVVTANGNNPVGLLFAGSSTYTVINPIGPVLARFNVTIDGSSGGEPSPPTGTGSPTVLSCNPSSGTLGEKKTIEVYGSDFQNGASVNFGDGIVVQSVSYVDAGQLNVKIFIQRNAPVGSRDVTVTNPDGQSGTGTDCFTVN